MYDIVFIIPSEARFLPGLDRILYGFFASALKFILATVTVSPAPSLAPRMVNKVS